VPRKKQGESFEEALGKLEKIVEAMEQGEMPLEKAMEAFKEGVGLVKFCHGKLDEAENSVQLLLKEEQEGWTTEPFDSSSEDG